MSEEQEKSNYSNPIEKGGPKLPYFHRTLSPQDAALIGDIAPKRIESSTTKSLPVENTSIGSSSAWNAAQTWEERDCSSWARNELREQIEGASVSTSESIKLSINKLDKVEGTANITHIRGKARYMYEMSISMDFEIEFQNESKCIHKGSASINEIINDQLDDMEINLTWKGKAPSKDVALRALDNVKDYISKCFLNFEKSFRLYSNGKSN